MSDALEACAQWRPDTIVAASQLDAMTGIDLAYAMSDHDTLSDVPLILTGDDSDLVRLEAFRAGVRDYVPTPFLEEELVIREAAAGPVGDGQAIVVVAGRRPSPSRTAWTSTLRTSRP